MDVYSMVTERIINQLEKGEIPWKKPWAKCLDGTFNRVTRRPYSLLNKLLLLHGGEYATFKQWEQVGGRVKKGEKAEIVVFWKMQDLAEREQVEYTEIPYCRKPKQGNGVAILFAAPFFGILFTENEDLKRRCASTSEKR